LALVLGVTLSLSAAAYAQYTDMAGLSWNNPTSQMLGDWIVLKQQQDNWMRGFDRPKAVAPSQRLAAPPPTTTFRPGKTRAVIAQAPQEHRARVRTALGVCDKLFAASLERFGVTGGTYDLAASTAFAVVTGHTTYWSGKAGRPRFADKRHFGRLREMLATHLLRRDRLAELDDVRKQDLNDQLVLMGCTPVLQYQAAKRGGDAPRMEAAQLAAAKHLRTLGLAPDAVRFEDDGRVTVASR
jgi:hypothetical protein